MNTVDHIFSQINLVKIMQAVQLCMTEPNSFLNLIIFRYFSSQKGSEKNIQEISPYSNVSIDYEVNEKNLTNELNSRIIDYIYANKLSDIGYVVNIDKVRVSVKQKDASYKEMVLEFYPKAFLPQVRILH